MHKLYVHLVVLPRWFGLPVAVPAVVLGGLIAGASAFDLFLAVMAGVLLMAYAHSWNSFHDYTITGFDKGLEEERSVAKAYTRGQSLIAAGVVSEREVFLNALGWLLLSLVPVVLLSLWATPWVWLPWGLTVVCSPWYSEAKKRFHPEVPLGLGFGPFAAMLGAATVVDPPLWTAFIAGLPIAMVFGVVAETADQHEDWVVNWEKGLRNMGAIAGATKLDLAAFLGHLVLAAYVVQGAIVLAGVLVPLTFLSLLPLPLFWYCMLLLEARHKVGILLGLSFVFLFSILLTVGQGIG